MSGFRGAGSRLWFPAAVVVTGLSGMIAQIVILRELFVTFLGNELSIGIILANWLLLEAAGTYLLGRIIENRTRKVALFVAVQGAFAVLLPVSLFLCRDVRLLFGLSPGEGIDLVRMGLFSLLVLLPVSAAHGALFTFGCRIAAESGRAWSRSAGRVYVLEVVGTTLGGLGFTYLLLPRFHSFEIVLGVSLLNLCIALPLLLSSGLSGWKRGAFGGVLAAVLAASGWFAASGWVDRLQELSVRRIWRGYEVLHYENSPYGNVTVTRRERQLSFYSDGAPLVSLPTPDIAAAEDLVHFPLLLHPEPRDVLVISGGAGGVLQEIERHPVRSVDYVELDPLILRVLNRYAPEEIRRQWLNPLVDIFLTDGRHRLDRERERYDVILVGLGDPSDLQVNRFFSEEFFRLAARRLKERGILALTLPGSALTMSEELGLLNACMWRTLEAVFPYVAAIPGGRTLFAASPFAGYRDTGAELLKSRLATRKLDTRVFTPFYIDYRLQADRRRRFLDSIADAEVMINRDYRPVGVFYSLNLWTAQFSPGLHGLFRRLAGLKTVWLLLAALALLPAFGVLRLRAEGTLLRMTVPYAIATTGFCAMLFDLIMVFAFQVVHGNLYQKVGLLVTALMTGTGLGAFATSRRSRAGGRRLFLGLEAGTTLFCLLLPVFLTALLSATPERIGLTASGVLLPLASLLGGLLVGAEFPVAVSFMRRPGLRFSGSVGLLNASDLLGGWIGGIVGGVILLPVLGLVETCLLLAALKVTAAAAFLLVYRRFPNSR